MELITEKEFRDIHSPDDTVGDRRRKINKLILAKGKIIYTESVNSQVHYFKEKVNSRYKVFTIYEELKKKTPLWLKCNCDPMRDMLKTLDELNPNGKHRDCVKSYCSECGIKL